MSLTDLTADLTAAHALVRATLAEYDAALAALPATRHSNGGSHADRMAAWRRVDAAKADWECARAVLERCEREVGRRWRVVNEQGENGGQRG